MTYLSANVITPSSIQSCHDRIVRFSCALLLVLATAGVASAASASWNVNANGNWTLDTNWTAANPQATTDVATFADILTTNRTVTLNASRSIDSLVFNANTFGYTLSGTGYTLTLNGTNGLAQNGSANATINVGTLTLATNQIWSGNGTGLLTISRPVAGTASLTKEGAFTLVLSGTNTFTGNIAVNDGVLRVSKNTNLGNAANDLTFDGGTLNTTASFSLGSTRTITLGSGGGTFDTNSGTTFTLGTAGQLSGAGTLTKTGAGQVTVTAANTGFSGAIDLQNGTLRMSERQALGTGTVEISNSAILQLNYTNASNSTLGSIVINDGSIQRIITSAAKTGILGPTSTLTVNGNASLVDQGTDNANGYLSIEGAVLVNSGGTLTANAANSSAAVSFGGSASNITLASGSTLATTGTGTVRFGNGAARTIVGQGTSTQEATLQLGATTHTADAGTVFQVNGSGTGGLRVEGTQTRVDTLVTDARLAATTGSGGTFTVAYTDNGSRSLGTAANLTAASGVSLGLVSNGGTFSLGTAGGATGDLGNWAGLVVGQDTTVSFDDNYVFSATADLTLLGGTLALNGTNQSFGSLVITGDSIIDFGGSASSLSISSLSIATGVTLTISNWADSVDYFYALNDPGATNLSQVVFTPYSASDTHWLTYDKQITPVPEPATYGVLLIGSALALHLWRRRRR